MKNLRIVVDGEPGSGKTTLINLASILGKTEGATVAKLDKSTNKEYESSDYLSIWDTMLFVLGMPIKIKWAELGFRVRFDINERFRQYEAADIICYCTGAEINSRIRAFRSVKFLQEKYPEKYIFFIDTNIGSSDPRIRDSKLIYNQNHRDNFEKFLNEGERIFSVNIEKSETYLHFLVSMIRQYYGLDNKTRRRASL